MAQETVDLGSRYLDAHVRDGVLHVRINRPEKRNATTQDMYRGLKRAAIIADTTAAIDVLCLTGTGAYFGAGGDMSGEAEDRAGLASELDPTEHFPFRHFERCRKAVLSVVNGLCHAGALNLVLFSDLAIASDQARFRAPELLRGAPDPWIASRLAAYVGVGVARYLLFTAAELSAAEALTLGLVGRVVPHAELTAAAAATCQQIRRTAPQARAAIKDAITRGLPVPDVQIFQRALQSPELMEGLQAFLEKRPPRWPRG
ncbi:MAG: enoyl-CoA hydratase/isomerase family protein [Deltaproteobacteria bacterium]|nr:enoyl-CoA hydratase/isomerase family protein [Deltaproteobacteria bacterium]